MQPAVAVLGAGGYDPGSSMAFIDGTVVNVALPALQSSLMPRWWTRSGWWNPTGCALRVDPCCRGAGRLRGPALDVRAGHGTVRGVFNRLRSFRKYFVAGHFPLSAGHWAAAMVPSSLAIISASFDEKSRGQAIGTWGGLHGYYGRPWGRFLGGWLIEHASWRWLFSLTCRWRRR